MSNHWPTKVSVVVPVFNAAGHLQACIDSLLNQTLANIEIVFVNDGSTDQTLGMLRDSAKLDPRIKVLDQANQGASAARNLGMKHALGQYVYFFDSDDILDKAALSTMFSVAEQLDLDVLHIDAGLIIENEKFRHDLGLLKRLDRPVIFKDVVTGCELGHTMMAMNFYMPNPWLYFIKNDFLKQHSIQYYPGITNEDVLFSYLLLLKSKRAFHINEKLIQYRVHAGSITGISNISKTFLAHAVMHHYFAHQIDTENMTDCSDYYSLARKSLYLTVINLPHDLAEIETIREHVRSWPNVAQRYHALELLMAAEAIHSC